MIIWISQTDFISFSSLYSLCLKFSHNISPIFWFPKCGIDSISLVLRYHLNSTPPFPSQQASCYIRISPNSKKENQIARSPTGEMRRHGRNPKTRKHNLHGWVKEQGSRKPTQAIGFRCLRWRVGAARKLGGGRHGRVCEGFARVESREIGEDEGFPSSMG